MGKPASRREPGWLCLPNCAGTQLLPGNRRCFLSKMQRWDRMGHLFFSVSSTSLEVISVAWLPKSALAPGCPTHPVLDPRGTLGLLVGWYSEQAQKDPSQPSATLNAPELVPAFL